MTATKISSVVLAVMFVVIAVPVDAGTINLNDIYNSGDPYLSTNYMWLDIVESNGTPEEPGFNYYRNPHTVGDTLIVNPTNFRVDVTPGPGLKQIDSQLEMVIMGAGGGVVPFLSFMESGDFEVNALSPDEAFVSATVNYFYEVLEGTTAGESGSGTVMFDADSAPNDSGLWSLSFDIDLPDGATKVRFEFENRLISNATTDLSSAFIAKKVIDGIKISVPEPSAAMIVLLGLFAAAIGCRKL